MVTAGEVQPPTKETSVNDLYSTMARVAGVDRSATLAPARPGELFRSALDAGRAGELRKLLQVAGLDVGTLDDQIGGHEKNRKRGL